MTTTTAEPAVGSVIVVWKYGGLYPAIVLHVTPTRVKVRFTTKGGKTKELFVPKHDVKRPPWAA